MHDVVVFYARFKDDILIIVKSSFNDLSDLIDNIRVHAKPLVIKVDSCSQTHCQMLHVNISLVPVRDREFQRVSFSV